MFTESFHNVLRQLPGQQAKQMIGPSHNSSTENSTRQGFGQVTHREAENKQNDNYHEKTSIEYMVN